MEEDKRIQYMGEDKTQEGSVYGGGQGGEERPVQSHACDALYLSSNILLVTVII